MKSLIKDFLSFGSSSQLCNLIQCDQIVRFIGLWATFKSHPAVRRTPSTLFQFIVFNLELKLDWGKDGNKRKEADIGPYLKKITQNIAPFNLANVKTAFFWPQTTADFAFFQHQKIKACLSICRYLSFN